MREGMKLEAPKSLTELVVSRLEQAIVDGEFGLGEAISEETLAKTFGVSRTPVRDALTALQRSGLVVVLPKRGSFVFQPSAADTAALCDYRLMFEREGLRLSCAIAKAETRAAMQAAIDTMEACLDADAIAYGRADTRFHQAFFHHCGNAYLTEGYRLVSGKVAALRTHLTAHVAERRVTSLDEHRKMAALFGAGDLDALFALLTDHIRRTREVYDEALAIDAPLPRRLALT